MKVIGIIGGTWMVDAATEAVLRAMMQAELAGQEVTLPAVPNASPLFIDTHGEVQARYEDDEWKSDTPSEPRRPGYMVWPVKGILTKDDQYWSNIGISTLVARMQRADREEDVLGHIMEIDSGGGQASYIETAARAIRALQKPVIAHVCGVAGSAAYYLASAADEIVATESADMFGSVGGLMTLVDVRGAYEKQGMKLHEIYAPQSTLKNEAYNEAREGEYSLVQEQILRPLAAQFIATVQEFRPALTEEAAYQGRIYTAPQALAIGMIDAIRTREEVIMNFPREKKSTNMFGPKKEDTALVARVDNVDERMEMVAQGVTSLKEQLDRLEASATTLATALATVTEQNKLLMDNVTTLETRLATVEKTPGATAGVSPNGTAPRMLIAGHGVTLDALEADLKAAFESGGAIIVNQAKA